MPNTPFMQEITRRSYDNYLDAVDNGQPTAQPHYLEIPKGESRIPSLIIETEPNTSSQRLRFRNL